MKKNMFLTGTVVLALAGASLQSARAGDREWATVGKVLTGVAVVGVVAAVVNSHAHACVSYSCATPDYCPPPAPPVVCSPPPAPPCNYYPAPPPPVVVYRAPVMVYPSYRYARHQERFNRW